jgi:transcriptional regulator with XRE-family HTH domain
MDDDQHLVALGRTITQLREERSLSDDALASMAGIDRGDLDALEAGRLDPAFDVLLALANALGVDVVVLILRTEGIANEHTA